MREDVDDFVQEDIRLVIEASRQQQQQKQPISGVEDLSL
jgi:hypothetical protein